MNPEQVIAQAIRFDNDLTANAERIVAALAEAGFVIVAPPGLPETARTYAG